MMHGIAYSKKSTVNSDGTSIKVIEEIEFQFDQEEGETIKDDDNKDSIKYYKTYKNGEKIEISKEKYDEIYSRYIFG